jgi:probable F420-dependent oxidoreductase
MDRAGVDRLVVSDHVVFGDDLGAYGRPEVGGRRGGQQPTGPDGHWLEPLTTLAVIAGRTARMRLGTNILLAALRRPVVLAKALATLDVLSGGRLDLGVGVGWQRAEYEAAGLDFESRGNLLDQSLAVCKALWTENPTSVRLEGLAFENVHMMPKPLQPGGVPVWVSGSVIPPVVSRLAHFGAAWIPWGSAAEDIRSGIKSMNEALQRQGHDSGGLRVLAEVPVVTDSDGKPSLEVTVAQVPEWYEFGVTDFRISWPRREEDELRALVDAFRSAAGSAPHRQAS